MSNSSHRLFLIGNYPPDGQASMALFAQWVKRGMTDCGWDTQILMPPPVLAKRTKTTLRGCGKWLGYIDKFILFPRILRRVARENPDAVFHVVDHSNAAYCAHLPAKRTLLTCHDVLAIEGAFGDPMAFCPASKTGTILQRWILRHLHNAPAIAFVSHHTESSYLELPGKPLPTQRREIVPNGINQALQSITNAEASAKLAAHKTTLPEYPFFLHVGSALPRKNRIGILRAFASLRTEGKVHLVFAGKPLSTNEVTVVKELQIGDSLRVLTGVSTDVLEALYNLALGLVFPSFSEGFGWPIIEAQNCGCPVIVGSLSCLPGVAGESGALQCDPREVSSIAAAMRQLFKPEVRAGLIEAGTKNLERFNKANTLGAYAQIFNSLRSQV